MHKIIKSTIILLSIIIIFSFSGCSNKKEKVEDTGFYFDTAISITLYDSDKKTLNSCFDLCEKYENMFSNTIENSEISKINENSLNGEYTTVSDDTLELIKKGMYYGDISSGKFDITIGNLSSLWNFTSEYPHVPNSDEITKLLSHINYKNIDIDGNKVLLKDSESKIDLGGIAKGYIADKLKEHLLKKGVQKGMINLGGNVLLIGSKPDDSNYNIGIQKPFGGSSDVISVVNANDISIVTSGVYERFFYENNVLYHHILDTTTGRPVKNNLLSVTILSKSSVDGDGLSTTAFSLGLEKGMKLIEESDDIEAIFIDDEYNLHITSGLSKNGNTISFKK